MKTEMLEDKWFDLTDDLRAHLWMEGNQLVIEDEDENGVLAVNLDTLEYIDPSDVPFAEAWVSLTEEEQKVITGFVEIMKTAIKFVRK